MSAKSRGKRNEKEAWYTCRHCAGNGKFVRIPKMFSHCRICKKQRGDR